MLWKYAHWIGQQLWDWILPIAVVISLLGSADKYRKAKTREDGGLEFAPNPRAFWAWPLMVTYFLYATIDQILHIHGRPLNLITLIEALGLDIIMVMIVFPFPGKIILTADGLEQVSWLWKNKRIRWPDIVEINTGEKSSMLTITAAGGTKIAYNSQLPDRPRLLMELRRHCGENLPSDFPREPTTDL